MKERMNRQTFERMQELTDGETDGRRNTLGTDGGRMNERRAVRRQNVRGTQRQMNGRRTEGRMNQSEEQKGV